MTQEFVTYEQALELKELGFDEPCFGFYTVKKNLGWNSHCLEPYNINDPKTYGYLSAPLKSQFFKWIRDKYNIHYTISVREGIWYFEGWSLKEYKTYEEAENACINHCIKIIELLKT